MLFIELIPFAQKVALMACEMFVPALVNATLTVLVDHGRLSAVQRTERISDRYNLRMFLFFSTNFLRRP